MSQRAAEFDSGWVGAAPDDDLDERMAQEDEEWDRAHPYVATALGPVSPAALGPVLAGEPFANLSGGQYTSGSSAIDGRHALLAELEDAYASGARTVVSVPAAGGSDSGQDVAWLAGRTQVHLVQFALHDAPDADDGGLPERVGGIATPVGDRARVESAANRAAAAACPLRLLAVEPTTAALAVEWAIAAGFPPRRLAAGGCDWLADPASCEAAMAGGASIVLDAGRAPDAAWFAAEVARLVVAGFGDRLLLTAGLARPGDLLARGGRRGLGWPMERIPLALMEAGLDALAVRRILVDNPARTLTIGPGE